MYRISFQENKDFSKKRCFLTQKSFRPGKVIVELARKYKGNFQPVGFIRASEIKSFDFWREISNPIPLVIDLVISSSDIRDEQVVSKIKEIIQQIDKTMVPVNKAITKIGINKIVTLSLEEYHNALQKQGIKCNYSPGIK